MDGAERKHFKGTKGKRLSGEAQLISGGTEERRLFYFGKGVAEVAMWRLTGPALMDFGYKSYQNPKGQGLHYQMKILVFPGNGVVNGIMNMGLFKRIVYGKIREVLIDITDSARKLAESGDAGIQSSAKWTAEEKRKIEQLLKLP